MSQLPIKNKHLKDTINRVNVYLEDNEDTPMDLFFEMMNELKVSNLILPVGQDSEGLTFETVTFEDENATFIPLFTDSDEYESYFGEDTDFEPVSFDFSQYVDLVGENDLDGIIIDLEGTSLPLDKDFLQSMYIEEETLPEDDLKVLSADELKEILDSIDNDSLIELITSDEEFSQDKLFAELSCSTLLNIVSSDEPLDEFAVDGIVKSDDVGGFDLCNFQNDDLLFGGIFTDIDSVKEVIKEMDGYYYVQITKLTSLFEFSLVNDMDGVIINPGTTDFIIMREEYLSQASGIDVVAEDPRLRNSLDYAFQIDE